MSNRVLVPTLRGMPDSAVRLANELQIYQVRRFLNDAECEGLIAAAADHYNQSRVITDGDHVYDESRTSESCFLSRDYGDDPWVQSVHAKLMDLYGWGDTLNSDPLQLHKYDVGQLFAQHADYYDMPEQAERVERTGQRTWTMIVYLNDDFMGGETKFPFIGLKCVPRKGTLVLWNNLFPEDGEPNPLSQHAGLPVAEGTKYLLSKWFRDMPVSKMVQ